MQPIETVTLFETPFGPVCSEDCPADIWNAAMSAKVRKDGQPDRRSPQAVKAWLDVMDFAKARFQAETERMRPRDAVRR